MNTEPNSLVLPSEETDNATPSQKDRENQLTLPENTRGHDALSIYFAVIAGIPLLKAEKEVELSRRWIDGKDISARNELIEHNLRLAKKEAGRFYRSRMSFDDIVQQANLGLITAAGKYDYRRGARFTTHAVWWIRDSISKAIAKEWELVQLPSHVLALHHKIWYASNAIREKTGKNPTPEQLAKKLTLPIEEVNWGLLSAQGITNSIDVSHIIPGNEDMAGDEDLSLWETVVDKTSIGPELGAQAEEELRLVRLRVDNILEALENRRDFTTRDAEIFKIFYGLDGSEIRRTLRYTARQVDLTFERVRQVNREIWRKLSVKFNMNRDDFLQDLFCIEELEKLVAS